MDSYIIKSTSCESGIDKLQKTRFNTLSPDKNCAVKPLLIQITAEGVRPEPPIIALTHKSMKRYCGEEICELKNVDTEFILPASNICERLNSIAKKAVTDNRKFISPSISSSKFFVTLILASIVFR